MADSEIAVSNLTVAGGSGTLVATWQAGLPSVPLPASLLPYMRFDHFEVYVSTTNVRPATATATTTDTTYPITGLGYAATRWVWVRAVDSAGNFGDFSTVATGTTNAKASLDPALTDATNLISNSNLSDATGWDFSGGGAYRNGPSPAGVDPAPADGTITFPGDGGFNYANWSVAIPCVPGEEFYLSFYAARANSTTDGNLALRYTAYSGQGTNGKAVTFKTIAINGGIAVDTWTLYTATFTAPSTDNDGNPVSRLNLNFRVSGSTSGNGNTHICKPTLNRRNGPTVIPDQGIQNNHLGDAQVSTSKVPANNITLLSGSTIGSDFDISLGATPSSPKTIASVTLTPNGGGVIVIAVVNWRYSQSNGNAFGTLKIAIAKNGTNVGSGQGYYDDSVDKIPSVTVIFYDPNPGTSSVTYAVTAVAANNACWYAKAIAGSGIVAMNGKR